MQKACDNPECECHVDFRGAREDEILIEIYQFPYAPKQIYRRRYKYIDGVTRKEYFFCAVCTSAIQMIKRVVK